MSCVCISESEGELLREDCLEIQLICFRKVLFVVKYWRKKELGR